MKSVTHRVTSILLYLRSDSQPHLRRRYVTLLITPYRRHRCLRHALYRMREIPTARFISNCYWWSEIIILNIVNRGGVVIKSYTFA